MKRRAFLKLFGSGVAGLCLATNLPISLPKAGPVHDGAKRRLLEHLYRLYNEFTVRHGRQPIWVSLGPRAMRQFADELEANVPVIISFTPHAAGYGPICYRFKGCRVRELGRGWEISLV